MKKNVIFREIVMKLKKSSWILLAALASAGILLYVNGCKKTGSESITDLSDTIQLCTQCGQIKESALCCQPNQPKCTHCGLIKGSPGCCNIPKDAKTAAICTKCGQMKGGPQCCKLNQPKCSMCGLVKDSPGCCKIKI
jgi:hypothetical protein